MLRRLLLGFVFLAAALAAVCLALVGMVDYVTRPFIYAGAASAAPAASVAIVPGASVLSSTTLSGVLEERADEALALYRAHKVATILVTGDNRTPAYDEVDPTARYLEARGVATSSIMLDRAGYDTYLSMYRAKAVFGVTKALIVSQPFHLPRAVFIARSLGINAYGVEAGAGEVRLFSTLRELPAVLKALWDTATHRTS